MPERPSILAAHPRVTRRPISVEEFRRMRETGILRKDEDLELIDGVLIEMPAVSTYHDGMIFKLSHLLRRACGERVMVVRNRHIELGTINLPRADLAVFLARPAGSEDGPAGPTLLLLIEIGEDSLDYDRAVKTSLYAQHAVPEYWLVDLPGEAVEVHRRFGDDGYTAVERIGKEGALQLEPLSDACFPVATLFA